jgi:hypothetical protein
MKNGPVPEMRLEGNLRESSNQHLQERNGLRQVDSRRPSRRVHLRQLWLHREFSEPGRRSESHRELREIDNHIDPACHRRGTMERLERTSRLALYYAYKSSIRNIVPCVPFIPPWYAPILPIAPPLGTPSSGSVPGLDTIWQQTTSDRQVYNPSKWHAFVWKRAICGVCGQQYNNHPQDWRTGGPTLTILCDGRRVKL